MKSQSLDIPLLRFLLQKQEKFLSLPRAKSMLRKFIFTSKYMVRKMRGRSIAKRRKWIVSIFR